MSSPVIVLNAPTEIFVGETELFDCRSSAGLFKRPQPDGSTSFRISYGDGDEARLLATGHKYRKAGTYFISVSAKSIGGVESKYIQPITVRDIPAATAENRQVLVDTGSNGTNMTVLQKALDLAASRNFVEQEIVVPAGFKAAGMLILTNPVGDKYITIRSDSLQFIPDGERVEEGDEQYMFQVLSVNGGEAFRGPLPANGTNHYRFQGMKVSQVDSSIYVHHLSSIGSPGGPYEIENLAHHLIFDRCVWDGGKNDTDQIRSGAAIYGSRVTVMNSRLAEFRRIGAGVDSQAIGITIGGECYSFDNNYLAATSESVNLGAGGSAYLGRATVSQATTTSCVLTNVKNLRVDMNLALQVNGKFHVRQSTIVRSIDGNRVTFDEIYQAPDEGGIAEWQVQPSFIEFRRNWSNKELKWWVGHPQWNGITYQIKNHYESKFSLYTVVDGNIFENGWQSDQSFAIALSPRNASGGESFASVIREFQFTNNITMNCAKGINLLASDYNPGTPEQPICTQLMTDIHIDNDLFINVGVNWDSSGAGHQLITMQNPYSVRMKRIYITHVTDDSGYPGNEGRAITDFGSNGGADESIWMYCVHRHGGYGIWSMYGGDIARSLKEFYPPGDSTNVRQNLIVNSNNYPYPAGSFIISNADWKSHFVDYDRHNFTLSATSPGKGAAPDGSDLGVDYPKLAYVTRGCRSGKWLDEVAAAPTLPVPAEPIPPPVTPPPIIPLPTPAPLPPSNVSPDGTKASVIIDNQGGTWTIGINNETLRDGQWMSQGLGTEYKWLGGMIYTHGLDKPEPNWHRWTGMVWTVQGKDEPGVATTPVEPQPVPAPSPTPAPVPPEPPPPSPPCSISAPVSVSIPKNGSGMIAVRIIDASGPVEVKVIGSDGQVAVSPLSWSASPTSAVKQFSVRVKKNGRTITFQSPCGSASVKVNVT